MFLVFLIGSGALLGSLVSYGITTAAIVHLTVGLIRAGFTGPVFWKNVAVMMIVAIATAATHLIQIALWAAVFVMCGVIAGFDKALYFSAQNYTSLGSGDIILSERWRLLGPLEAINGLLLFGLSTSLMFAIMSRLIANRLRFQLGDLNETTGYGEPQRSASSLEQH